MKKDMSTDLKKQNAERKRNLNVSSLRVEDIEFYETHLVAAWLYAYKPEVAEALMEELIAQSYFDAMEKMHEPERNGYKPFG